MSHTRTRSLLSLAAAFALAACDKSAVDAATDGTSTGTDAVDLRVDFPAPPEGGIQFLTEDFVIPANSERMFCQYLTYDGPTVGMHAQQAYQSEYGHHVTLNGTSISPLDKPDGTVEDCTGNSTDTMADVEPLLIGGDVTGLTLPTGFAAYLESGQRIVLQSHYVNTSDDDILVKDAINLDVLAPDAVETWAAPFAFALDHNPIPVGAVDYELSFDCTWNTSGNLLFLGGHMHEWGSSFAVDDTLATGGEPARVYEVATWDAALRDAPTYNDYAMGEFAVAAGDTFKTTCAWTNDTDHELDFPEEMCAAFGMYYPAQAPFICSPDLRRAGRLRRRRHPRDGQRRHRDGRPHVHQRVDPGVAAVVRVLVVSRQRHRRARPPRPGRRVRLARERGVGRRSHGHPGGPRRRRRQLPRPEARRERRNHGRSDARRRRARARRAAARARLD